MTFVLKLCCIFCVRSLLEAGGVDRLMNITRQRSKYTSRVVKFASQVTYTLLQSGFVCLRLAALRHLLVYLNKSGGVRLGAVRNVGAPIAEVHFF